MLLSFFLSNPFLPRSDTPTKHVQLPPSRRQSRSRNNSTSDICRARRHSPSPSRHGGDDQQTFSTIRRAHSPFRARPLHNKPTTPDHTDKVSNQSNHTMARRPPRPKKFQPLSARSDSVDILTRQDDSAGRDTVCVHIVCLH